MLAHIFTEELRKASHITAAVRAGATTTAEVATRCRLPVTEVASWNKLLKLNLVLPDSRPHARWREFI